jgi:hypothetical protein
MVYPKEKDMKKLFLAAPLLAFLLVSCPSDLPEATIINNSSYPVTFYIGQKDYTLPSTESINIQLYGPPNVSNFEPKTVSYKRNDMTGEFTNATAIDLYVLNTGSYSVELSTGGGGGYIELDTSSSELTPLPAPQYIKGGATGRIGVIYTSTPVFTAYFIDSGVRYPATVNYDYEPAIPRIAVTVVYSP